MADLSLISVLQGIAGPKAVRGDAGNAGTQVKIISLHLYSSP